MRQFLTHRATEMNHHRVTYAEVKLAKGSKSPQVKPQERKSCTTETEQGITYTELNLHKSRGPQENGKSRQCKVSISLPAGSPAPTEKLIAGVLGCACLVLICVIVALKIKIRVLQSIAIFSWIGVYRNGHGQPWTLVNRSTSQLHCGPCPQGWFTYSRSCYYSSAEKKTWNESVSACQRNNSQLLLIDNDEEMGWLTYSNSCYYFSPEPKTWNESVSDCQRNNSQLLLIDNDEEMGARGVCSEATVLSPTATPQDDPSRHSP
ncbi:PREDICTED: NKG2-A/NKG2-B type II integral membrane protein-like [Condylura cristata]|uniref:NKG2-A/NKG2-B type II integral membrane protein-like n=1 Tax=Condylura cristata TaxID=143302 RepID=UPI00064361B9|nr:PREDICTED: NKG2-A/NKG2-B type II integral membrane protein-like [Condylura cristata]